VSHDHSSFQYADLVLKNFFFLSLSMLRTVVQLINIFVDTVIICFSGFFDE